MHTSLESRKGHESIFLMLILLLGIGCSRPVAVPSEAADADHQAPFRADTAKPASSQTDPSAQGEASTSTNKLPFREQENVPAGTLISVRLNSPITITGVRSENLSFQAVVVDPVVIEGAILIPKGTAVAGKVESARTSQLKPNRGYVRLALASVQAGGIDIPVQTASLFARQSAADPSSPTITLEKGRRLTFALSEPVYIASPRAKADH